MLHKGTSSSYRSINCIGFWFFFTFNNQEAAVRWNGQLTVWFPIEQGTRQGCNVSPTEFNLYAERIMRTVEENYEGVVIGGRRITNLRYADDATLLATTQDRIRKFFKDLVQDRQDNISVQVDQWTMKENHWSKCTTLNS